MKKRIGYIIISVLLVFALIGCGSISNWWNKIGSSIKMGDYKITLWDCSGKPIKVWDLKRSFVNIEPQSDGWYFIYNGKLVRLSGTVTIEEQ